jgi:hypothetical protein
MNRVLSDHVEFRGLLRAWLTAGRAHAAVEEAGRAAACGYCFGGMAMFEMVLLLGYLTSVPVSDGFCV